MAVSKVLTNGKYRFRISYWHDGKRRYIRLDSKITQKRHAERIDTKIQELATCVAIGSQPDTELAKWLMGIDVTLHDKLSAAGLTSPRALCPCLGKLCDEFIAAASVGKKSATITKYQQAKASLTEYSKFGEQIDIRRITADNARAWRHWLATESNKRDGERTALDDNTVRRRTGLARQIFKYAIDKGYINDNPFSGLPCVVGSNRDREYYVERDIIDKALGYAPNAQWRALIALSRYTGLRVPSEVWALTWADVDLADGWLTIRASKTAHHSDRGVRRCPIFPELRPFLDDLAMQDKPGIETPLTAQVIRVGGLKTAPAANLRTKFTKILRKAGITPWPKLWHNMRATRETELLNCGTPIKDVCEWLGNSQAVAMKHYAMATQQIANKAIAQPTGSMPDWQGVAQQVAHSGALYDDQSSPNQIFQLCDSEENVCFATSGDSVTMLVDMLREALVGPEGLEPPTKGL